MAFATVVGAETFSSQGPLSDTGGVVGIAAAGRVEPIVIAALVNRFIVESEEFLQSFAQHAEEKLLQLNGRIRRLETLVHVFERKLQHLDPADDAAVLGFGNVPAEQHGGGSGSSSGIAGLPSGADKDVPDLHSSAGAAVAEATQAPREVPAATATPVPAASSLGTEKYAVYCRMARNGVPLAAVRQRLLLDALQDPSLDVSELDGLGPNGSQAAPPPVPAAALPAAPVEARVETSAPEVSGVADATPEPAGATAAPVQTTMSGQSSSASPTAAAGPFDIAAAAAAIAQRRLSQAASASAAGADTAPPIARGGSTAAPESVSAISAGEGRTGASTAQDAPAMPTKTSPPPPPAPKASRASISLFATSSAAPTLFANASTATPPSASPVEPAPTSVAASIPAADGACATKAAHPRPPPSPPHVKAANSQQAPSPPPLVKSVVPSTLPKVSGAAAPPSPEQAREEALRQQRLICARTEDDDSGQSDVSDF